MKRQSKSHSSEVSTLREIAFKGVVESLPLGSVLYDLIQARKESVAKSIREEQEKRIDLLFSSILHDTVPMDEQVARVMLDGADFHALLRACVNDIEEEKVELYGALVRAVAAGKVKSAERRHFILSLRDFSYEELVLLKKAYVAKKNVNIMPMVGCGNVREEDFLNAQDPESFNSLHISNLSSRGLVVSGKVSAMGCRFVESIFSVDKLTPTDIGFQTWSGVSVSIINYEIGNRPLDELAEGLTNEFRRLRHKSGIFAMTRSVGNGLSLYSSLGRGVAVLFVGAEYNRVEDNLQYLFEYMSKAKTVGVFLEGSSGFSADLPFSRRVYFSGESVEERVGKISRCVSELL